MYDKSFEIFIQDYFSKFSFTNKFNLTSDKYSLYYSIQSSSEFF